MTTDDRAGRAEMMVGMRAVELLCSRLCHDLVSPVSAIGNGVELLEDSGMDMSDEALQLIAHSADVAARRLKMFRVAFGAAGGQADLRPAEVQDLLRGWFQDGKIGLAWADGACVEAARGVAKLVLVAAIMAEECLPLGGTVAVAGTPAGGAEVVASGQRCALRPEARAALEAAEGTDPPGQADDALTPRGAVAFMAVRMAAHYGLRLTVADGGDGAVRVRMAVA